MEKRWVKIAKLNACRFNASHTFALICTRLALCTKLTWFGFSACEIKDFKRRHGKDYALNRQAQRLPLQCFAHLMPSSALAKFAPQTKARLIRVLLLRACGSRRLSTIPLCPSDFISLTSRALYTLCPHLHSPSLPRKLRLSWILLHSGKNFASLRCRFILPSLLRDFASLHPTQNPLVWFGFCK